MQTQDFFSAFMTEFQETASATCLLRCSMLSLILINEP